MNYQNSTKTTKYGMWYISMDSDLNLRSQSSKFLYFKIYLKHFVYCSQGGVCYTSLINQNNLLVGDYNTLK